MRIVFAEYVTYDSAYKVGGHHLSQYVAAAGHSVLYLSAPLHVGHLRHWFKRDDSSWYDLRNSFVEWWRGGITRSPNLISYTPLTLVPPWRYGPLSSPWVLERTLGFTVPSLKRRIGSLGFHEPDVLVIAHPFFASLMGMVHAKLVLCRVNDDIGKFETMPASVSAVEKRIAQDSDVVIVTSSPLCGKFDYVSQDRLYYLPNGVDFQFYQSGMRNETAAELRSLGKPVIVYMGALNYWFDIDLLAYCAHRLPDHTFVLIGALHTDMSALERLPNVHLLGRRPYEQLPTYLRACDVGIIPFRVLPLIEAVSPLKLYEYMACGLPVVATRWRELESLRSPAQLADSPEQFADMIEQACAEGKRHRHEYIDFAKRNSWNARGERLLSIILRHSELSSDR